MTLPTSGQISIQDIATEFGGTGDFPLSDYYAGAASGFVPAGTEGTGGPIPSTGQISLSDFYGAPVTAAPGSQVFTSSGTFIVPIGITQIRIDAVGGGGGGGSGAQVVSQGSDNVQRYIATGGGGGAAGEQFVQSVHTVTPGQSITVTIGGGGAKKTHTATFGNQSGTTGGSGGSTVVGSLLTARGGQGGSGGTQGDSSNIGGWPYIGPVSGGAGYSASGVNKGANAGGASGRRKGDNTTGRTNGQPEASAGYVSATSTGGLTVETPFVTGQTACGSGGGGSSSWGAGSNGVDGKYSTVGNHASDGSGYGSGGGGGGGVMNSNTTIQRGSSGAGKSGRVEIFWG